MDQIFNEKFVKLVAQRIPCVHMNSWSMSKKITADIITYLEELKSKGLNTIDDVLKEIQSTDQ